MKLLQVSVLVVLALASSALGYTLPTVHELQNTERMLKATDEELSAMVGKYEQT